MQDELRPDVVTLREVARQLRLHERTVANKIKRHQIALTPVPWSNYRMLFLRRDVERLFRPVRRSRRPSTASAA